MILYLTFDDLSRSCNFKLMESKPRMSYCVIDTLVIFINLPYVCYVGSVGDVESSGVPVQFIMVAEFIVSPSL